MPVYKNMRPETVYYIYNAVTALICARYTIQTIYYIDMVRMDPLQLLLIGTVLESTYLLAEIPTGIVADAYSRRVSVIVGVFTVGAACLIEGLFPFFTSILVSTAILSIGLAFLSGATEAWLADEVGDEKVGPVLIRSRQIFRVVFIGGTCLVIVLASFQMNYPVLLAGILNLILGIFLILFMSENNFQPVPQKNRNNWHLMFTTFRSGINAVKNSRMLLTIILITVVWGISSEGYDWLCQAHLWTSFSFSDFLELKPVVWIGIISLSVTLVSLIVTQINRKRFESVSRHPVRTARWLTALSFLTFLAGLGLALTGNFTIAFIAFLVYGVAGSVSEPLYNAWLIQHSPSEIRATVISIVGQSNSLGQIAGGPVVGVIGKLASVRTAITISALLYLPVPFLYGRASRKDRNETPEENKARMTG